jgi:hypothetical protein
MPAKPADTRKLEPVKNNPGVYRRHADGCPRKRCHCPYVVRWKDRDRRSRKQLFPTLDQARVQGGAGLRGCYSPTAGLEHPRRLLRAVAEALPRPDGTRTRGLDPARVRDQLPASHPAAVDRLP